MMRVYLSGRVEGLADRGQGWMNRYSMILKQGSEDLVPVNPTLGVSDGADPGMIVRHCMGLIGGSDALLVNADIPFAMGCPMEIAVAKYYGKLVVAVVGEASPYHKKHHLPSLKGRLARDWIHPFLIAFSDHIVGSPEEAVEVLKEYLQDPRKMAPKTLEMIL